MNAKKNDIKVQLEKLKGCPFCGREVSVDGVVMYTKGKTPMSALMHLGYGNSYSLFAIESMNEVDEFPFDEKEVVIYSEDGTDITVITSEHIIEDIRQSVPQCNGKSTLTISASKIYSFTCEVLPYEIKCTRIVKENEQC